MKFDRLRLKNWKCYEEEDVPFDVGITVVHGVNGSGKSTLLEACFFALYGTDTLPKGTNREDVVTNGKFETEVELWFTHSGANYRIYRRVRISEESDNVYMDVELETPTETYTQITPAEKKIKTELRMDAKAFLNCSYVRQGDITRLIYAPPEDRQNIIDRLLQLGKLETYRERMDHVVRGTGRIKDEKAHDLETVGLRIDELETQDLDEQLAEVEDRLETIGTEIQNLEQEIEDAKQRRDEAQAELDEYEQKRIDLERVRQELEAAVRGRNEAETTVEKRRRAKREADDAVNTAGTEAREALAETDIELDIAQPAEGLEVDPIEEAMAEVKTHRDELETEIDSLSEEITDKEHETERLEEKAERLRQEAKQAETEANDLEEQLEARRTGDLAEQNERLDRLQDERQEKKERFAAGDIPEEISFGDADDYHDRIEGELRDLRGEKEDIKADLESVRRAITHAESLIEEGRCPECGQEVSEAPRVTQLDDKRTEKDRLKAELEGLIEDEAAVETELDLADGLQTVEQEVDRLNVEIEGLERAIDEIEAGIEREKTHIEELRTEVETKREQAERASQSEGEISDSLESLTSEREKKREEYDTTVDRYERLEQARNAVGNLVQAHEHVAQVTERVSDAEELLETKQQHVGDLTAEKESLENEIDEERITPLEEQRDAAESELSNLRDVKDSKEEEQASLNQQKGQLTTKLGELDEKYEEQERLATEVAKLESAYEQCQDVQEMYSALRTTLREANVSYLEQLVNEIFSLVYENDSYARIELNRNYEMMIYEKSGEPLDPDDLSGGEQALFNLSLRCAIYQLLAEGIEGQAPLPPLILDEPTVHLDETHVGRINDLATRMRQLGVDQTVVVSHQREIVDSADERIHVEQDSSTNRSKAAVESTDLLAGL